MGVVHVGKLGLSFNTNNTIAHSKEGEVVEWLKKNITKKINQKDRVIN